MQKFFLIVFFVLLTIISSLYAGQHTVELTTGNDYGLVYREDDPENMVLYDLYQENIGIPPRRDLRIGLRNYRIYKSYFIYDLSGLSDDITINSVRVLVEMEDRNYTSDRDKTLLGLTSNYDPQTMFHDFTHQYNILEISTMDVTWNSSDDAIVSDMQSSLTDDWFGLKLEFSAEPPDNNIYYESKKIRVWVTYTIPDVQITVNTNPSGMQYSFNGGDYNGTYQSQQVFTVEKGTSCTRSTTTPQTLNNETYDWENWSDGLDMSASFTAGTNKTITANFRSRIMDMTVTNDFDGGIVGVDGQNRDAPYEAQWTNGTTHSFEAIDQDYQAPGEANYFREFYEWEKPDNNSTNQRSFSESVDVEGIYKANFHKWFEYEATNDFINGGSGGEIKIDDITKAAPYSDHVVEDNSISTEAFDQQQTVNGRTIDYHFICWQDGNAQNPYTFMPSDHFYIQAKYKGHLVSNHSRPSGYPGGRCLAYGYKLHMVYEDGGQIYYTGSEDDGQTWTKEEMISDGVEEENWSNTNPSIAVYEHDIHVCWAEHETGYSDAIIHYRHKNDSQPQNQWSAIETPLEYYDESTEEYKPKPVIAVFRDWQTNPDNIYPVIVTDYYGTSAYSSDAAYRLWAISKESGSWEEMDLDLDSEEITGSGKHPSLSADKWEGHNDALALSYDLNGEIFFRESLDGNEWTEAQVVSVDTLLYSNQQKSSVSFVNREANIVWEGLNLNRGNSEILFREAQYQENGDLTVFRSYNVDLTNASAAADNSHNVSILYQKQNEIYKNKREEDQWSGAAYYGGGKYPSIADHLLDGAVWTTYDDAPFILKTDWEGPSNALPGGGVYDPPNLDFIIDPSQNGGQYGFISLEVQTLEFNQDTLALNSGIQSDTIQTASNSFPIEMDLKVRFRDMQQDLADEEILFSLYFMDTNTQDSIFLTDVRYKELPPRVENNTDYFIKAATIVNLGQRNGYVKVKFSNIEPHISYAVYNNKTGLAKDAAETLAELPETYRLSQNFPNPFNPITHITFDLPQLSEVNLTVFNINGQAVRVLAQGNFEAGRKEVVFDAGALATGVYFYRLTAGNFVQTKRMLLIK